MSGPTAPFSRPVSLGWRRELADWQPSRLWLADLAFQAVEALVAVASPTQLDPFAEALVRLLGSMPQPTDAAELGNCLRIERGLLNHVLSELRIAGLAVPSSTGHWSLTSLGRAGLAQHVWQVRRPIRQVFHFVVGNESDAPNHFLALSRTGKLSECAGTHPPLDLGLLRDCIARSEAWKQQHRFPSEVLELLDPGRLTAEPWRRIAPWLGIAVARRLHAGLALIRARDGLLLGFHIDERGRLDRTPIFTLDAQANEVFPELVREPTADELRAALLAQGAELGIALDEVRQAVVEPWNGSAIVRGVAGPREAHLLVGQGRLALVAPVEFRPADR